MPPSKRVTRCYFVWCAGGKSRATKNDAGDHIVGTKVLLGQWAVRQKRYEGGESRVSRISIMHRL